MLASCPEPIHLTTDLAFWYGGINEALEYDADGHTWLEVCERVKSGEFKAVEVMTRGLLIVEIIDSPKGKQLNVVLACGKYLKSWLKPAIEFLCTLAYDQGCAEVRVAGRPGWQKLLTRYGFRHRATLLSLEVI